MTPSTHIEVDDFPCGCFVTDASRRLVFANRYIYEEFDWTREDILGESLEKLMPPASHLFCESYLYPLLSQTGRCEEIQLTFKTPSGVRIPVIANARQVSVDKVVWSVFCATNRDKLYQELVSARNRLEDQTRQLKVLSYTDELTGLTNRRAFNEIAKTLFKTAATTGQPICLMLVDIDDFKKINDTHGHSFGDDILRGVGECLANVASSVEAVARFGGEEFIFALTGADVDGAVAFADSIHAAIKNTMRNIHPITVSIGVASRFSRHGPSFAELLSQADKALYEAKANGKNMTVIGGNVRLVYDVKSRSKRSNKKTFIRKDV